MYQDNAAPVAGAPAFISAYSTQTDSFISAVSALPSSYPGGTDAQTNVLGARCSHPALVLHCFCPIHACLRGCGGRSTPCACMQKFWLCLEGAVVNVRSMAVCRCKSLIWLCVMAFQVPRCRRSASL